MTGLRWLIDQYLQLPRWERIGNIAVMLCIFALLLVAFLWPPALLTPAESAQLDALELSLIRKQQQITQSGKLRRQYAYAQQREKNTGPVFIADINTASFHDLVRAGLSKRVAAGLRAYVKKGGRIKTVQDAKKIYGITPEMLSSLLAHTQLDTTTVKPAFTKAGKIHAVKTLVDLNTADSAALTGVNGISAKMARVIINYREKIGMFHSVAQLNEMFKTPLNNFEQLRGQLTADGFKPFIHINAISEKDLAKHPYFRKAIAAPLVAYRDKHGPYKAPEDLKKCAIITDDIYVKIIPYIVFD